MNLEKGKYELKNTLKLKNIKMGLNRALCYNSNNNNKLILTFYIFITIKEVSKDNLFSK